MTVLAVFAVLAYLSGVTFPENSNSLLEPNVRTFALAVGLAPILEEMIFRGPLSGKLTHLLAVAVIIATIAIIGISNAGPLPSIAIFAAALLAIILLKITMGGRAPLPWFARRFPLFFWLSTVAFAALHFLNFQDGLAWILIPLVAPQFILGTICGYLRVSHGLWSSVLLHALHNATALGIAFSLPILAG